MDSLIRSNQQSISKTTTNQLIKALDEALNRPIKANPYTAQISRKNPAAIIILIDQSGSMKDELVFRNTTMSKANAVTQIVNELLEELLNRCTKTEGIRDYFEISLIEYGGKSSVADFAWQGKLEGRGWVKMAELAENPISTEIVKIEVEQWGELVESERLVKTWLKPFANFQTPMLSALKKATALIEEWITTHDDGDHYPPIVFNITDGAATDAKEDELLKAAKHIQSLHTTDGYTLLFNIHIDHRLHDSVFFPRRNSELPNDTYAKLLYNMSSVLPSCFNSIIANARKEDITGNYTAMVFNGNAQALVMALEIGTTGTK